MIISIYEPNASGFPMRVATFAPCRLLIEQALAFVAD
jgi:hypothetical protein